MSEPSSALGFEDLIKAVAEEAGIAYYNTTSSGRALIPVDDPHNLDLCKRIVNDGIREFIANAPLTGWRWMRRTHSQTLVATTYSGTASSGTAATLVDSTYADTYDDDFFNGYTLYIYGGTGKGESAVITDFTGLTCSFAFTALSGASTPDDTSQWRVVKSTSVIDADRARYILPQHFGGLVDGPIYYERDSNHSSHIVWRTPDFIDQRRAINVSSGYPQFAAFRPYEPTTYALTSTRRWELIVDPQPSAVDVLQFPYTIYFDDMRLEGGIATASATTTLTDTTRWEANDYFNGWTLTILDGTGRNETATITDYVQATGVLTFTALSGGSTPDTTSVYKLEPASNLHPAGFIFDSAIKSACLANAEIQVEEINKGLVEKFYKIDLPNAHKLDMRSAPRTVGNMNYPGTINRERDFNDVTYNGE